MLEETASDGSLKADVHLEKHAHASMTRTRRRREGTTSFHLLRQVHRTETRQVTEKVAMTEVPKAYQNLQVKFVRESEQATVYKHQERILPKKRFMQLLACSRMYKIRSSCWMQIRRHVCAHKHTAKPADEKEISASSAIHIPSNDERQKQMRKIQSDDKTQYRVRFYHFAKKSVVKRENGTNTWSHPDRISKSAKSKRSNIRGKIYRMDFEHGRQSKDSSSGFRQESVQHSRLVF